MATIVFGAEIILKDHADPVTADADIGLYNITSDLSGNAASGQKDVDVDDGSIFVEGQTVTAIDDNDSETCVIDSISGNTLTMFANLTNAYTTAANAKVDGNSVFRWIQNDVSGLSGWKAGMIIPEGISEFTRSIDLSKGGNIARAGYCNVTIQNTDKFWEALSSQSIYLNGLECIIYEFADTSATCMWRGTCEQPEWTATQYRIPIKTNFNKRKSNLSTIITESNYPNATGDILGKIVPLTFGTIKPKYDEYGNIETLLYAKMFRTANKQIDWLNNYNEDAIEEPDPSNLKIFKVVSGSGLTYTVKIAKKFTSSTVAELQTELIGKYIFIFDGDNNTNIYRKIANITNPDNENGTIDITIENYLEIDLDSTNWIKIIDITREYVLDIWPCKDFINKDNDSVSSTSKCELNMWDEDDEVYRKIPEYVLEVESGDTDNNRLVISSDFFEENPDDLNSFVIKPITDLGRPSDLVTKWGLSSTYKKFKDGIFENVTDMSESRISFSNESFGTVDNAIDKDKDSSYDISYRATASYNSINNPRQSVIAIEFKLPPFPDNFTFDSIYLQLKSNYSNTYVSGNNLNYGWETHLTIKRFTDGYYTAPAEIRSKSVAGNISDNINNILDQYYEPVESSNNEYFFSSSTDNNTKLYGYTNIELSDITTKEKYEAADEMLLHYLSILTYNPGESDVRDIQLQLYELAVMFKKSISIEKKIYTLIEGRIFNDTWESRKTSANLMETPLDILEHVCRLQNWSEVNPMPTNGWGKGYASKPKIKTSGTGSFDAADPELTPLNNIEISRQIFDEKEAYSDELKKSLCNDFHLANWIDKDGYECVKRIVRLENSTTPSDTVTLADIIDRDSIVVKDPNPADMYPEPFVRFDINNATGEPQDAIRITNIDADSPTDAQKESYVEGLTGADAVWYWNECHEIWLKCREIKEPPSNMTDLKWANGEDALDIAKEYLMNWIQWMRYPSVSFTVHYNKAKTWEECHNFILQLPHQTNNVEIECMITDISINPNPPYNVDITAIMYRADAGDIVEDYLIQDTMTTMSNANYNWQDHMDTYSERGEGLGDKQDTM